MISTGGTISCRPERDGSLMPAASSRLIAAAAERASVRLSHREYASVFGTALGLGELFEIVSLACRALEQPQMAGVVITAGTGIIEEGAYLSELLNRSGKPIVWTGAQHAARDPDFDGPRNLGGAIRVAAAREARTEHCGAAALVCFNEEVLPARDAVKVHKSSVAAFSAGEGGALARADEDRVVWLRRSLAGRQFEVDRLESNVDLIPLVAGSDDRFFRASLEAGARGIVVQGFPGVGMICPGVSSAIARALDRGVVVVLSSRSPHGRMLAKYGGEIGGATLVRAGVLLGGNLAPAKLRIGLAVLLSVSQERDRLSSLAGELWP
ncbi:MAG TPA: asparaginase [Polyangiaceae bacterium]|nr:asparaginase [Polyangiaceae bacterium]